MHASALILKDERGPHLLSHRLAAQRLHNGKSKLKAGSWPPAGEDQAVLLHSVLGVAVMTFQVKTKWVNPNGLFWTSVT